MDDRECSNCGSEAKLRECCVCGAKICDECTEDDGELDYCPGCANHIVYGSI